MEFETPEEFQQYVQSTGRSYVTFTIYHSEEFLGKVTLELFTDICPRTCQNFIQLVRGKDTMRYQGTPIHRVVRNAYVQGGDVVDGTGKGDPIFTLPDETFAVQHDQPGILAMATNGEPHTGSTQFYITLAPLPWLDGKRVAFGKVLTREGFETLDKLQAIDQNNERPLPEVSIHEAVVDYEP